jgi:hypothetical protein
LQNLLNDKYAAWNHQVIAGTSSGDVCTSPSNQHVMIIVPGSSNLLGVEFAGAKFISSSVSDATRYRRIGRRSSCRLHE